MKKVSKIELEYLVKRLYDEFINEEKEGSKFFRNIDVNTIYICVKDWVYADAKEDIEAYMENFTDVIEKLTLGNLKVAYKSCYKKENSDLCFLEMYISINYEVE